MRLGMGAGCDPHVDLSIQHVGMLMFLIGDASGQTAIDIAITIAIFRIAQCVSLRREPRPDLSEGIVGRRVLGIIIPGGVLRLAVQFI